MEKAHWIASPAIIKIARLLVGTQQGSFGREKENETKDGL
jgi:hypothetical protein